jgi:DNA-binding IscR family transcriptional regulator
MKRDAYGQLEHNSYPLLRRVGPVEPTTPWAMRLTDSSGLFRFLCFDFDGKDKTGTSPELVEQAVDDSDQLSRILHDHGIPHVVCQSSSSGGRHLWVAIRGGAAASIVAALGRVAHQVLRTLDYGMLCNPSEGSARPPLSPHRNGSRSVVIRGSLQELIAPQTTADALTAVIRTLDGLRPAMQAQNSEPSGPVDIRHHAHRRLSKAGEAHMGTIDGGGNPSWTGFMCLLSAAVAGWDFTDVVRAARTAPGMEHYRTKNTGRGTRRPRSPEDTRNRLERQWSRAQAYAALYRPLPRETEPRDLSELQILVDDLDIVLRRISATPGRWRAEAGQSQLSILRALAYLTLQTGKSIVAASIRDLALMTGLGRTTAATALQALSQAGLIQRDAPADGGNAAEWRLTRSVSTTPNTVRSQPFNNPRPARDLFDRRALLMASLEQALVEGRHDLFTRGGLGHLAGRLYAEIAGHRQITLSYVAKLLGVGVVHATTVMSRLRKHRLLVKDGVGWTRSRRDLRDAAARVEGVWGALEDRARRYAAERETWAWWQAEVITMSTPPQHRPRRPHVTSRPIFTDQSPGERTWPRYPRSSDRRGDHKSARLLVLEGALDPERRFQYLGDAA